MPGFGRKLIIAGIVLVMAGIIFLIAERMGAGKLPGDIVVKRERFTFYFPVVTSIILSLLLTFILYLINRYR